MRAGVQELRVQEVGSNFISSFLQILVTAQPCSSHFGVRCLTYMGFCQKRDSRWHSRRNEDYIDLIGIAPKRV